ncbi:MAG: hypothetical protein JO170_29220 [Verrucomicrobia bacterium]|nr:hypothetical protein [Verrucomicrobiota bacterium]
MTTTFANEIIRPALIAAGYRALRKSKLYARKGNLTLAKHYRQRSREILSLLIDLDELEGELADKLSE